MAHNLFSHSEPGDGQNALNEIPTLLRQLDVAVIDYGIAERDWNRAVYREVGVPDLIISEKKAAMEIAAEKMVEANAVLQEAKRDCSMCANRYHTACHLHRGGTSIYNEPSPSREGRISCD